MKKFPWLLLLLPMLILGGCGKTEEPPTPQPYGKLAAITYSRTHGSMYGYDFYINLTPEEIDYTDYFLEGDLLVKEEVPVEETHWQQAEALSLEALPKLREIQPKKEPNFFQKLFLREKEVMLLDGGDSRSVTLVWQTENGEKTVGYSCPGGSTSALEEYLMQLAQTLGQPIINQ